MNELKAIGEHILSLETGYYPAPREEREGGGS